MTDMIPDRRSASPAFSIPAILAVICAVVSWFGTGSGILTILLAVGAIVFGLLGLLISLSPTKRGGILSVLSIGAGGVGLLVGIVRIVRYLSNGY